MLSWLVWQEYTDEVLRHRWELSSAMGATWIEWSCAREVHLGMNNGVGQNLVGWC